MLPGAHLCEFSDSVQFSSFIDFDLSPFNREAEVQEKYDELSKRHQRSGVFGYFFSFIVQPVIAFVDSLAYIAVAVLGGWLVLRRGVSIGSVVTIILFLTDWRMAIPVVLLAPLSILLSAKMAGLGEKHWDNHYELGGKLTSLAEEAYTNYPTTKAFNREPVRGRIWGPSGSSSINTGFKYTASLWWHVCAFLSEW